MIDGAGCSLETAEALADELLAAKAEYLPQFGGGAGDAAPARHRAAAASA